MCYLNAWQMSMNVSKRVVLRGITVTAIHGVLILMAPISVSASPVIADLISSTVWNWMSAVLENTPVTNMQIVSTHLAVTIASVNKAMRVMDMIASVSKLFISLLCWYHKESETNSFHIRKHVCVFVHIYMFSFNSFSMDFTSLHKMCPWLWRTSHVFSFNLYH